MKKTYYERVYDVVSLIPVGRVTSYGAIAKYLGTGMSARMVGYAMNHSNKSTIYVPAHRVVNRNGLLTGKHHFDTPDRMRELLENEGVIVIDDVVQDFVKLYWDPNIELQ